MEKLKASLINKNELPLADNVVTLPIATVFLFFNNGQIRDRLLKAGYLNYVVQKTPGKQLFGLTQAHVKATDLSNLPNCGNGDVDASGISSMRTEDGRFLTYSFSGIESVFEVIDFDFRLLSQAALK